MARNTIPEVPPSDDVPSPEGPAPGASTARGRRFVRLFLTVAGGLAAPSLALAAFFLSSSGGDDTPAARSSVLPGGRVTATTVAGGTAPVTAAPPTTTTTTTTAPLPAVPPRDPFVPLVTQTPAASND